MFTTHSSGKFDDPIDLSDSLTGISADSVLTERGSYSAKVTTVDIGDLRFLSVDENLSRVVCLTVPVQQVALVFPTRHSDAQFWGGVQFGPHDIAVQTSGGWLHHRTTASSSWGVVSIGRSVLARWQRILDGHAPAPGDQSLMLRTAPSDLSRLRHLHAAARRLCEVQPDAIAHPEVSQAIEQETVLAIVHCLRGDRSPLDTIARQRAARIMMRLEQLLSAEAAELPHLAVLAAKIGVSERDLRRHSRLVVGMAPGLYIRMRRLGLARAVLKTVDPNLTTVSEVARRFGFSQPSRFAVSYRAAFGEPPSVTLRYRAQPAPRRISEIA